MSKLKHWRGVSAEKPLKAAPVLEFCRQCRSIVGKKKTGGGHQFTQDVWTVVRPMSLDIAVGRIGLRDAMPMVDVFYDTTDQWISALG